MKTNSRRIALSCFAIAVAAAGLAIPTPAQAQYGQQRAASQQRVAEGTMQWGADGWCYVVQGGRWVRTSYSRRFPDQRNYPNVFDIYQNGRFIKREGASAPAGNQTQAGNRQLTAAEAELQQLVAEARRLMALGYGQTARPTGVTPAEQISAVDRILADQALRAQARLTEERRADDARVEARETADRTRFERNRFERQRLERERLEGERLNKQLDQDRQERIRLEREATLRAEANRQDNQALGMKAALQRQREQAEAAIAAHRRAAERAAAERAAAERARARR